MAHDPLVTIKRRNVEADRRHVRRAFTPAELARLLDTAARRPMEAARKIGSVKPEREAHLARLGETRAML